MHKEELFEILYGKDKTEIYKNFLDIENDVLSSDEYYEYIEDFVQMLSSSNSTIKLRGLKLLCRLAKYDSSKIISSNINLLLPVLDDEKGSIVRQALKDLEILLKFNPWLEEEITNKLCSLNLSQYKDSMRPLIEKDIKSIFEKIAKKEN